MGEIIEAGFRGEKVTRAEAAEELRRRGERQWVVTKRREEAGQSRGER